MCVCVCVCHQGLFTLGWTSVNEPQHLHLLLNRNKRAEVSQK